MWIDEFHNLKNFLYVYSFVPMTYQKKYKACFLRFLVFSTSAQNPHYSQVTWSFLVTFVFARQTG